MQGMSSQQDRRPPAGSFHRPHRVGDRLEGDRAARWRERRRHSSLGDRPEMGTLLAIDTANTIVLAIVSALSVPVPAQREGDSEIWIAELGLVGELLKASDTGRARRSIAASPSIPRSATACASP